MPARGEGAWGAPEAGIMGGAGGTQQVAGDYFYRDQRRPFTAVGLWGLQRVLPYNTPLCPILRVDGSTC